MATDVEALTAASVVKSRKNVVQFQHLFTAMTAKVTLTEASIAAAKASQASVTITGAAVGDIVALAPAAAPGAAFKGIVTGVVTAADTVLITVLNVDSTDAMTDLSAGIVFNVILLQPKNNWAAN